MTITKLIIDAALGTAEVVELSAAEIAQFEANTQNQENQKKAEDALAASKAIQKAELLAKLGITADEAALLA